VHQSLAKLFVDRVEKSADRVALHYKDGKGPFRDMTWREYGNLVEEMAFGLAALGLSPGSFAAIISNTSYLWTASDLAILSCGAVSVPIYPTSSSGDVEHILNESAASVLFVQNEALLARVLKIKDLHTLKTIVLLTPPRGGRSLAEATAQYNLPDGFVIGLDELQQLGRRLAAEQPGLITERCDNIKWDDLATVIYTSGTTGTPKGVMLLNSTILSVCYDLPPRIPLNEDDVFLSFLPLSHVFERVCGEFYWLLVGNRVAYAEGIEHLSKNMQEIEPTALLVVPRLLDKIYNKVMSGVKGASSRAQILIEWAIAVGSEVVEHQAQGKQLRVGLKARYFIAEKLVLKKMRERIGRRIKLIVSGGAPATPQVIEFFNAVGMNVLEGYGLTETAAPTNVNVSGKNKIGTVGPSLSVVETRIAEDGEILFKGPTIFRGYYKNDQLTAEVFTDDWFHTGDIGIVDADGYLKITDRKKDLIVNSAGKNIAPQKIEAILRAIPQVSQAVVFGDKRKSLVALITLDEQPALEFAAEQGWHLGDYKELTNSPEMKKYLKEQIEVRSKQLCEYEQVRNISILPREFSVEEGELTATMKVKRNVLKLKYQDLIDSLYTDENALVGLGR
jgi:long-chain acyl-CoA synthetase